MAKNCRSNADDRKQLIINLTKGQATHGKIIKSVLYVIVFLCGWSRSPVSVSFIKCMTRVTFAASIIFTFFLPKKSRESEASIAIRAKSLRKERN